MLTHRSAVTTRRRGWRYDYYWCLLTATKRQEVYANVNVDVVYALKTKFSEEYASSSSDQRQFTPKCDLANQVANMPRSRRA